MGQVNGVFIFRGAPTNGAEAKLWHAAGFVSPPEYEDPEPNPVHQEGATLTTGIEYGGDGGYRWTSVPDGEYYVSCYYQNHRVWIYAHTEIITDILTDDEDLLVRRGGVLTRIPIDAENKILSIIGGQVAWSEYLPLWVVSDGVQNSNDAVKFHSGIAYTKKKEIKLNEQFVGDIRIKFDLATNDAIVYGRIYRNGVALGTERTTTGGEWVTFSEDFADVNWAINDLIQIYTRNNDGVSVVSVQNFRLCYSIVGISTTNQDP